MSSEIDISTAIVSTVRNCETVLDSFIRYHLAIGFDRIYLFFDDPDDPGLERALKYPEVCTIKNDVHLQDIWTRTYSYLFNKEHISTELISRQVLNAEVGLRLALKEEITWLLHIDVDELFYCDSGDVHDHFKGIDPHFAVIKYLNDEAVPEELEMSDFFMNVTVFKKNPHRLSEQQVKLVRDQSVFENGKTYFWFYINGKSAVRVTKDALPSGPHEFKAPGNTLHSPDAKILHYPICGFQHFWNKYKTLGMFADNWFGKQPILSKIHLESRDVVCRGNKQEASLFYQQKLMDLKSVTPLLLQHRVAEIITFPQSLLSAPE